MPYVKASRSGVATTVYIPWPQALETGLQRLAREALAEPGVSSVELLDDCRSRISFTEKRPTALAAELRAEREEQRAEERKRAGAENKAARIRPC